MTEKTATPSVRCLMAEGGRVRTLTTEEAIAAVTPLTDDPSREQARGLVWIDVAAPGPAEETLLRDRLRLHPLAIEDALRGRQRPKIDRYPGYVFIVFYAARLDRKQDRVFLSEVHVFLGADFMITVHDRDVVEIDRAIDAWSANPSMLKSSVVAAHALLDAIVDDYFATVEYFSQKLDDLEEGVFDPDTNPSIVPAFDLRHQLVVMRRIIVPERDVLNSLIRHEAPFLHPEFIPYFQDVYDHLLRVGEEIDTFRDLLTGLIEVHSSDTAKRLNETMQTLTAWSIILMSVTLVAGIYGMNFIVMPELRLAWGYYGALGLMAVVGLILAAYFRRRGWL